MKIRYKGGLVFLAAVILIVPLLAAACGQTSSAAPPTTTAKLAPDFSGETLDGSQVSLSGYRGKPVVLVFMASW